MRLVIFTRNYPPIINPRSFRIGNFVKTIQQDQDVLIITSDTENSVTDKPNIIRVGPKQKLHSPLRDILKQNFLVRFFHKFIWPDDSLFHQIIYLFHYLFKYRNKDDIILTVSNPFSSHLIGIILKKIWSHQWQVDIGDIYFGNRHKSFLSKWFENTILQTADKIVLNASSIRDHYITTYSISSEKFIIRPNGIHWNMSKIKKLQSENLRLSFFGNTYPVIREGLKELNILIAFTKNNPQFKMRIQLFGRQYYRIYELMKLHPELIQISYCNNEAALINAYSNTDVLINFANKNNPGLPSKLEEYLVSGLPILNFIYTKKDPSFDFLNSNGSNSINILIANPGLPELYSFFQSMKQSPDTI